MSKYTKQVIDLCRVSGNKARDRLGTPETSLSGRKTRTARNVRRSMVVPPVGNIVIKLRSTFNDATLLINRPYYVSTLRHEIKQGLTRSRLASIRKVPRPSCLVLIIMLAWLHRMCVCVWTTCPKSLHYVTANNRKWNPATTSSTVDSTTS